jgi:hypothetical protein
VSQVYACTDEVQQEWVAFMKCQYIRRLEESGFEDGDVCCLEACLLVEAVVSAVVPDEFSHEIAPQRPRSGGNVMGAGVIAGGRE